MEKPNFDPNSSEIYQMKKGQSLTTQFKGTKPRFILPKKYILMSDGTKVFNKLKQLYPVLLDMTYEEYKVYHNVFIESLIEHITKDTDGIKIPKLGEIYCKRLFISKEAMLKGLYMNLDSNGKIGKIIWKRTDPMKHNLALKTHAFTPSPKLKKRVSIAINENPNDYKIAPVLLQNIKQAYPTFEKWINSGGRQKLTQEVRNDESRSNITD